MARGLDARAPDFEGAFAALISAKRETEEDVAASVRAIIADVRARGDAALIELSAKFDKVNLTAETLAHFRRRNRRRRKAMLQGGARCARCRGEAHRDLSPPPDTEG